jgi:hypothetical protein
MKNILYIIFNISCLGMLLTPIFIEIPFVSAHFFRIFIGFIIMAFSSVIILEYYLGYEPKCDGQLRDYWVNIEIYDENGKDNWELTATGSIKSDGCSNWDFDCMHFCGPNDSNLFKLAYEAAKPMLYEA